MEIRLPIPENIALLTGLEGSKAAAVEKVLKGCDLWEALTALGEFWKIRVWFNCEHRIQTVRHVKKKEMTLYNHVRTPVHTFNSIVKYNGALLYKTTRSGRKGYIFPDLCTVLRYEPVITQIPTTFVSYEQFARKFDRRFITESKIQTLWNQKSSQHGEHYKPSDFRRIGPAGKRVLKNFLRHFVDLNTVSAWYYKSVYEGKESQFLTESYSSGRTISISHTMGQQIVYYASELPGKGRYGLLANENEFLHLEDD